MNLLAKQHCFANGQQKQFLGLILLDKGVLRGHQKSSPPGDGEITSSGFSPTLQQSIALPVYRLASDWR